MLNLSHAEVNQLFDKEAINVAQSTNSLVAKIAQCRIIWAFFPIYSYDSK